MIILLELDFTTGLFVISQQTVCLNLPSWAVQCAVCTSSIKQDESERTKKMMMHNAHGGEEQISRMQKVPSLGFCPIQFIAFKYLVNN